MSMPADPSEEARPLQQTSASGETISPVPREEMTQLFKPISLFYSRVSNTATFEEVLEALVAERTGGRDWRTFPWPADFGLANLHRLIDPKFPLPSWRLASSLLEQLDVPLSSFPEFRNAYERAKLYRPWSDSMRLTSLGDGESATYVINHSGGSLNLYADRSSSRRERRSEEPVIPDADGINLKPDPLEAGSLAELEDLVRDYRKWAGEPSTRKIAQRSQGIFSHATASKIIYNRPHKPPLKMEYLIGIIRGCGGDQAEQQRWVTAWRILSQTHPDIRQRMQAARKALNKAAPDGTLPPPAQNLLRAAVDNTN